ncbi:DUF3795 domain-containing protein [Bacteroidota bacterium]
MNTISVCGLICNECEFYNNSCTGCYKVKGETFWAKELISGGICPLYDCSVNLKSYKNCGECAKLPCQKFKDLKDPNISEKEHILGIKKRVRVLNSN